MKIIVSASRMCRWHAALAGLILVSLGGRAMAENSPWSQALSRFQVILDVSCQRDLASWQDDITAYSDRHYGEPTWVLQPAVVVLHYTAGTEFPDNLVTSTTFDGEAPGLSCHFVVAGEHVWQLLPPTCRSRGAFGINHRAINIEMVARDAADLAKRRQTLQMAARLVAACCLSFSIPLRKVYGHQDVATMDRRLVPEVLDRTDMRPYGKSDPGPDNLQAIKAMAQVLLTNS